MSIYRSFESPRDPESFDPIYYRVLVDTEGVLRPAEMTIMDERHYDQNYYINDEKYWTLAEATRAAMEIPREAEGDPMHRLHYLRYLRKINW